jgi:hypothetical protein
VDKQREFNKARVEAYTTCKSVTEAKTLIESKTGVATTITADSAVKTADSIKSTLEAERTKMTLAMYDVIHQQGFESFDAFRDFNDKSNFEVFKECYPVIGKCDWCGLDKLGEQNCIKLYGITDCTNRKVGGESDWGAFSESYKRMQEGTIEVVKEVTCSMSVCPSGHGFYNDVDNFKTPPFDVFWRA